MICSNCGKDNNNEVSVCQGCGTPFGISERKPYKIDLSKAPLVEAHLDRRIKGDDEYVQKVRQDINLKEESLGRDITIKNDYQNLENFQQALIDTQGAIVNQDNTTEGAIPVGVDNDGNIVEYSVSRNMFVNFIRALAQYFKFSGRATRYELWSFYFIWYIVLFILSIAFGTAKESTVVTWYSLLTVIPSWSILVRRLHDAGRSSWYLLIPFIGGLMAMFMGSQKGTNKWGHMRARL